MSWEEAINRVISHGIPRVYEILERHPYLPELASRLRKAREEVIKNLDHYIEMTMKSVQRSGGKAYLANDAKEAREIVGKIVGTGKRVVLGKSMVAFEIGLRKYLQSLGNEVWETDLGELLLQLTDDNPSHIIGPAIHMTKERVAKVLREKIGADVSESSTHEELVAAARKFLREKFLTADVGITGANAVAADTGSIVLVENEGNIRLSSSVPPVHISVTGVEKIVPTLEYAVIEALVQSAYWGLYPPTYINVTSGPSSTADIEHKRVSPAHGPKEFHLVLIDNGRREIAKDPDLWEGLLCIRCGRCHLHCPVYRVLDGKFGAPPYSGPMGAMWAYFVYRDPRPAMLCTHSGNCKDVCPMKINIPRVLERIKFRASKAGNGKA